MNRRARSALLVALFVAFAVVSPSANAAPEPSVSLNRTSVRVGERIIVTMHDWPLPRSLIISVCGNAAARGSVDCNLTQSQGLGISEVDGGHLTEFVINAPPTTCPCVIRVSTVPPGLVATTPIDIAGHPTGPIVGNKYVSPLVVSMDVHRAKRGLFAAIKSSLGGSTAYDVTVRVRNRAAYEVTGVRFRARAGRGATDQARTITLPRPGTLAAGQTWTHTQRVTLAAPVLGRFTWTVSASGAGPVERATDSTRNRPYFFYLLVIALLSDIGWIVWRRLKRRRDRQQEETLNAG